jgi:hypothetical protein
VLEELDAPEPLPAVIAGAPAGGRSAAPPRRIVDGRGKGILGSLSDLLSTRETLLAACADVSRRRHLLAGELESERFGRPPAIVASSRCAVSAIERAKAPPGGAFCLIDHSTLSRRPELASGFVHVFMLDPPPLEPMIGCLALMPPDGVPGFLHLGWGAAEIDFTRNVIEHEYGLRSQLASVYRALTAHPEGLESAALEAALAGEGAHPRPPAVAGRCLRILRELGLARVERSSATVSCTIISRQRVELERSESFRAYSSLRREALTFLSEPTEPMRTASAA